jgi:hypothetical protein
VLFVVSMLLVRGRPAPGSTAAQRRMNAANGGIRRLARERGFLLADLERLFHGHGVASNEPWFVNIIEPNFAGATAIAEHWYELLTSR